MRFSLLDLAMNGAWTLPTSPINVAILLGENQNTENVILQRDITKENCITCISASSRWTRIIMSLKFTYLGCYTSVHIWNKDSWHRRPAKTFVANFLTLTRTSLTLQLTSGVTTWDHGGGGVLVVDTVNTRSELNVHLYDSREHFMKVSI